MKKQTILIISDIHSPFMHPDAVEFLRALKLKYKPTEVLLTGDESDFHSISFHSHDPDLPSPGDELIKAINQLRPLYKMFPNATVLESNHGSLVYRKAVANGMPRAVFKTYNEILSAPKGWKWETHKIIKTPLGPIYFCHGRSGTAGRLASQYGMSCIQGHFHERSQIHWISTPERLMFDMHVGCLVDDKSLALAYNKVNPKRPIISIGLVVEGIPQIIPMILGKNGRWNRKIQPIIKRPRKLKVKSGKKN